MISTKEQERKALEKIKGIVEGLGEQSYLATAFKGCFEILQQNARCRQSRYMACALDGKPSQKIPLQLRAKNVAMGIR